MAVQRTFASTQDPSGILSGLCITSYFIDPTTSLVTQVVDMTHPDETWTKSFSHEIDFANYAPVNGVDVPMLVTEQVDGQMTWQLQLSGISFNVGLTDANFQLQ